MTPYKKAVGFLILTAFLISPFFLSHADIINITVNVAVFECSDGLDNDGDSLIDYPNDPGCDSLTDNKEEEVYACSDGLDNDGDSFIDFPDDLGCDSASDNDEYNAPPSGGGGGGSSSYATSTITLSGIASPNSEIVVLKNGREVIRTTSDDQGDFFVELDYLRMGTYIFAVYALDPQAYKSLTFSFPITVSWGAETNIEDIFLSPTFSSDKTEVRKGDIIKFFGYTSANSEIVIRINSLNDIIVNTDSSNSGGYFIDFDSQVLEFGDHEAQSRTILNNDFSSFGEIVYFKVGDKNVFRDVLAGEHMMGDINDDKRVNLVDFSIAAFWYKKIINSYITGREELVLNGDGKIDLIDFSIMAFHWTG